METQQTHPGRGLLVGGLAAAVIGLVVWLITANGASECSSAFVRAFNQGACSGYTFWHGAGLVGLVGGGIAAAAGAIIRARS